MKYVHGQVLRFSLMALYWFGRGVTGDAKNLVRYKLCKKSEPCPTGEILCTDEENISEAFKYMKNHIDFVGECIDHPDFVEWKT